MIICTLIICTLTWPLNSATGLKFHRCVCIYRDIFMKKSVNCLFHILFSVSGEPFAGFDIVEVVTANRYFIVLSQVSKNWL